MSVQFSIFYFGVPRECATVTLDARPHKCRSSSLHSRSVGIMQLSVCIYDFESVTP